MHHFRATIERGESAANSWCFVTVPADIARALGRARRVTGTVAATTFESSLMLRGGRLAVLVKRELRDALGLEPGHEIDIAIAADTRERVLEIPDELATALEQHPAVARAFTALPPSHRREFADWIAQAKRPQTKATRIERALSMIAAKRHIQ